MRILVVEDQNSIRVMIEALVRARGYDVMGVSSGAKALDVVHTFAPNLILLDLAMPGQYDGIEVCERIRSNAVTANIPIVVVSAALNEKNRARAEAAGATAFYSKPFSPMALLKELERIQGTDSP